MEGKFHLCLVGVGWSADEQQSVENNNTLDHLGETESELKLDFLEKSI
jgi:hypothetical protein